MTSQTYAIGSLRASETLTGAQIIESALRYLRPIEHKPAYPVKKARRTTPKSDGLADNMKMHARLWQPEECLPFKYQRETQAAYIKSIHKIRDKHILSGKHTVDYNEYKKAVTHDKWEMHPDDPRKDGLSRSWEERRALDQQFPKQIRTEILY